MAELARLRSAPLSDALTWYEKALEYADSYAHKDEMRTSLRILRKRYYNLKKGL